MANQGGSAAQGQEIALMAGLAAPGFNALARDARSEGFRFIDRLVSEWHEGSNRFDGAGEQLLGAFEINLIVGLGGLNLDPYAGHSRCGRIRRLYMPLQYRGRGIGRRITARLLEAVDPPL